jgi:class 3 adenylate cyclase
MPNTNFKYKSVDADEVKYGTGYSFNSLSKSDFEAFNSKILGLGDLSEEGAYVQALAAFYDLEGFTAFCNQVDSHLVVPEFLRRFVDWLFQNLAERFKEGEITNRVTVWGSLPFYTKFLGDGILLLWDTEYSKGLSGIINMIAHLYDASKAYQTEFLPLIKKHVSNPPSRLRCGVARGQIISVGNGEDYVGSCINIAARLQKLSYLPFAISRRGIDISIGSTWWKWKDFILKKVELRGIGSEELIYVNKNDFRRLPQSERKLFKNP